MSKKHNLKFFLALGNTKMVLLKDMEKDEVQVYSRHGTRRYAVSEARILDAVCTR